MDLRQHLLAGQLIPAHPLAIDQDRQLDERRQRALTRYYLAAGAGGLAVGVHTTQFAIRDHGLLEPVLALASDTAREAEREVALIAGVCGGPAQAAREARLASDLRYHAALLSLAGWRHEDDATMLAHCRAIAEIIPIVGFYLQRAVGGRALGYEFWRAFAEIPGVVAIKIAPFDRYATIDVVRAVCDTQRDDVALYTGNDDNIVVDLLTPFPTPSGSDEPARHIVGGLLGHWAVWTARAAAQLSRIKEARRSGVLEKCWLSEAAAVTEMNAAVFDVRHGFAGCIPGIHEVLRRQGLIGGTWCLDPAEQLSPGQAGEIGRVARRYPHLTDDDFVARHLDDWMR